MDEYKEWDGCDLQYFKDKTGIPEFELKQLVALDKIGLWYWFSEDLPLTTIENNTEVEKTGWFKIPGEVVVRVLNQAEYGVKKFISPLDKEVLSIRLDYPEGEVVVDVVKIDIGLPQRFSSQSYSDFQKPEMIPTERPLIIKKEELFILPHDLKKYTNPEERKESDLADSKEKVNGLENIADYLGVSVSTVHRWNKLFKGADGKSKVIKKPDAGGRYAYIEDLDAMKRKATV